MGDVLLFLLSRQHLPLVIGVCVGVVLSLLITPVFEDDCSHLHVPFEPQIVYETNSPTMKLHMQDAKDMLDDYEPRINLKGKPQSAKKEPQTLVRPRYYTTELGVKQKLFIAVLSSMKAIANIGSAINSTLGGQPNSKLSFFVDITSGEKLNLQTLSIIGFNDNNQGFLSLHTLKYLADKLARSYNFFLIMKDTTFVNGREVDQILDHISTSDTLYMGEISQHGNNDGINVCSLDAGILISSSVLQVLSETLEQCSEQVAFDPDDEKIGRCIYGAMNLTCQTTIHDQTFKTSRLPEGFVPHKISQDFDKTELELYNQTTIYPVRDPAHFHYLNNLASKATLQNIDSQIAKHQLHIVELAPKTPDGMSSVTWPIGFLPPSIPPSRFDVLRWESFNQTHIFLHTDHSVVDRLEGIHMEDIEEITALGVNYITARNKSLRFVRLEIGYRRFDASRGMDYILTLVFQTKSSIEIQHSVELCRPITHVDTVPMPYVTEVARINAILPLWNPSQLKAVEAFIQHFASTFMAKSDNIELHIVLFNGTQELVTEFKTTAQRFNNLYKKEGSKITVQNQKLVVQPELVEFFVADIMSSKMNRDTLLFFCDVHAELNAEFLNRVRINTISGWQVFSPIPFADYNPNVAFPDGKKNEETVLATNSGFFDTTFTRFVSFYMADYLNARKTFESELPFLKSSVDGWNNYSPKYKSIYNMFVGQRKLHVLRAVEPLLRLRYHHRLCYDDICRDGFLRSQGTRSQLAKLVLERPSDKSES